VTGAVEAVERHRPRLLGGDEIAERPQHETPQPVRRAPIDVATVVGQVDRRRRLLRCGPEVALRQRLSCAVERDAAPQVEDAVRVAAHGILGVLQQRLDAVGAPGGEEHPGEADAQPRGCAHDLGRQALEPLHERRLLPVLLHRAHRGQDQLGRPPERAGVERVVDGFGG
jgi:hypothetical protein